MNICFIFEFGLPPYRRFLLEALEETSERLFVFTGGDRFNGWSNSKEKRLSLLAGRKDNRLYWLNPAELLSADIIFSTLNLRRPHTWMWIFLLPHKKWVFWGQGRWKNSGRIVERLRNAILKRSSGYIAYTEEGKASLLEWGYPPEKITVAFNTLMVSNSEWTNGKDYLLYVGRIQPRKELSTLIKLLPASQFRLRIVGDTEGRYDLKKQAEEAGVDQSIDFFPGTFEESVLKAHFSGAIAYISPGHVGLGVVHAFAYAVPVITCINREHAPEFAYCSEENSYLCHDIDSLGTLVGELDPDSKEHRSKKFSAFKAYQENLSPEMMVSSFKRYLERS